MASQGMLYIVQIRMIKKTTKEKIVQRLLIVGCEERDISRKLKWIIDGSKYEQITISDITKIRQKVHLISSVITQPVEKTGPIVDGKQIDQHMATAKEPFKLYAVGITTTMMAYDERHVLRKVGRALVASTSAIKSSNEPTLSDNSIVQIEEIPFRNKYAAPRDVTNESNDAHIFKN